MSLANLLTVEPIDENGKHSSELASHTNELATSNFICHHHQQNFNQVLYGGQVFAQGIAASLKTVPSKYLLHSANASFLRPGSDRLPIRYEVIVLRDGRSILSRTVRAWQAHKLLLTMQLSFHKQEPGYAHQPSHEPTIAPEDTDFRIANATLDPYGIVKSFELGTGKFCPLFSSEQQSQSADLWLRRSERFDHPSEFVDTLSLAYASDLCLLATALLPHETSLFSKNVMATTITHHMWFHSHEFDSQDWMVFAMNSPWAGGARGFCRGEIFTQQGKLVASVVQEGLIRPIQN